MSYKLRPTSIAAKVIDHLTANPDVETLTAVEVSELFGAKAPTAALLPAVEAGLLISRREGLRNAYALAASPLLGDEQTEGPQPFQCALYNDGDLSLLNAGVEGDTSLVLTRKQTEVLREYLLHTGSWMERLQQEGSVGPAAL